MTRIKSHITVSLDGYLAGPDQSEEHPLGIGGEALHRWMFETGHPADEAARASILDGMGAFVMGRNMFGPVRGGWDRDWRGWWGEEPPYHGPVYVLTHHAREPLEMEGGTTFHFVTDGPDAALEQARAAAGDRDVSIAGGAATVNHYLATGAIDELTLDIAPIVLGAGARLFDGVGGLALEHVETTASPLATHVTYRLTS